MRINIKKNICIRYSRYREAPEIDLKLKHSGIITIENRKIRNVFIVIRTKETIKVKLE